MTGWIVRQLDHENLLVGKTGLGHRCAAACVVIFSCAALAVASLAMAQSVTPYGPGSNSGALLNAPIGPGNGGLWPMGPGAAPAPPAPGPSTCSGSLVLDYSNSCGLIAQAWGQ